VQVSSHSPVLITFYLLKYHSTAKLLALPYRVPHSDLGLRSILAQRS